MIKRVENIKSVEDIKNKIDKKYRPIPFWSWNEKLYTAETKRQVALMDDAGIGGYFMHARGGLVTPYMEDEWFDNVHAAADEGKRRGMFSWAYDENGWPSGFGGGKVNGLGDKYRQKSLHAEPLSDGVVERDNTVLVRNGVRYYYDINEFYVDVLDAEVVKVFIDEIYARYAEECGNDIEGFFTDEPQIYRGVGFPWSLVLEDKFKARYGYSLIDNVDALFLEVRNCERVRVDYWQLVTELFSESYFKQIYDWCVGHGYKLTGHLVLEESLIDQLVANGACMPHYEYFSIPGMDWLGRNVFDCLTPMQVSSVAAQTGKQQVISETFALSGHNVSHAELKRIYEWQMVHGINLLCTHLEGYSLRGIRKRDYPPAMYYQQPWWDDMHMFFESMSRIGMMLAEGEADVDVLLLHPQTTAWLLYNGCELGSECIDEISKYDSALLRDMRALEDKHIMYHLGDETVIGRHGYVENGRFVVGNMSYKTLVIPEHIAFLPYTDKLIAEFAEQGGRIVRADEMKPNAVTDVNRLSYTMRSFDEFNMHYFVNTDNAELCANINVGDAVMLPQSGELIPLEREHTFAPYESLVVIERKNGKPKIAQQEASAALHKTSLLPLDGIWHVKSASYNSLTLDRCDYSFDGELIERDGYVLNILPRMLRLRRPVRLHQVYRFECAFVPKEMFLAVETPDCFEINVNGTRVEKTACGYFRDKSFVMLDIAENVNNGLNVIEMTGYISQSEACYDHVDNSWSFESMKNCLTYDMEIEPIYIVGDFSLRLPDVREELDRDSYRIGSTPVIDMPQTNVDVQRLDECGFAEFAGELVLEKELDITDTSKHVSLRGRGLNSIGIDVNGNHVCTVMYPPYDADISRCLHVGKNTVTLKIRNNLRNMMGPHHLECGESFDVLPASFYKENNIFAHVDDESKSTVVDGWNDGIALVHFGLC